VKRTKPTPTTVVRTAQASPRRVVMNRIVNRGSTHAHVPLADNEDIVLLEAVRDVAEDAAATRTRYAVLRTLTEVV